ncbi:MAG: queuosine precursor transporter [Anaerolineales bacterium]|nr:queuosine precursor transporter [Anaerolineales bacterium]
MEKENKLNSKKTYYYFDFVLAIFIAVLLISNIASSAKIIDLGTKIFSIPLAFDAGTLLFPIIYIFGDILVEVYGFQLSRRVIWLGFFCLVIASTTFWIVNKLPGEVNWQQYAGDSAFTAILGGMSSGGIVLASLAGYLLGEFSNSVILAKMKILTRGRWLWTRTIGSTLVGELVDTLAFVAVASMFGVFPWSLFVTLTLTNYVFKVAIEIAFTPLTYAIVNGLKRNEQIDHYDYDTDFNPFRI